MVEEMLNWDVDGRYEMMFYRMDKTRPDIYERVLMYRRDGGWFIGVVCLDEKMEENIQEYGVDGFGQRYEMEDVYGWIYLPVLG